MISFADISRFERLASSGRNSPLLATVEADGDEIDVFIKPAGWRELTVNSLAFEALACCIGSQVGVPMCRPLFVRLTPEWINALPDQVLRDQLAGANPVAFGSQSAGSGWRQWSADDVMTAGRRDDALHIFIFDALINNSDRNPITPNLLIKGDSFRAIDHELSLRFEGVFPQSRPWELGNLGLAATVERHVLRGKLASATGGLSAVADKWRDLSDELLMEYEAALPAEWQDAQAAVRIAVEQMKIVRSRIDDCMAAIERVIA